MFTLTLPFTPLSTCLAHVDEFTPHGSLAFEKRIRVRKVDSQRAASNFDPVEVPHCGHGRIVIFVQAVRQSKSRSIASGKQAACSITRRTSEFAETIALWFSSVSVEYQSESYNLAH